MTAHPGVCYFLGISLTDPNRIVEWQQKNVLRPRRGVIMVWDEMYGTHNSDADRVIPLDVVLRAGWVPLRVPRIETGTRDRPSEWVVLLSPQDVNGRPTSAPSR
jgi:hypothetical protein